MLKIGELARRTRVTVKTLHHYDDIGLLKPAHVDPQTGYRHYTPEQEGRLNRILALKDLGLSLEQIGYLLDRDPADASAREILNAKHTELRAQLRDVQARITRVETHLKPVASDDHESEVSPVHNANPTARRIKESRMSSIQNISERDFDAFTDRLKTGRKTYLPMILGTSMASTKQTEWLDAFNDQYAYLIDPVSDGDCVYVLRRADPRAALWFSLILPSDWDRRFEILDLSLPNLIGWFRGNDSYRYLFAQLGRDDTPPTVLEAFLPTFQRHGFNTEFRMDMHRPTGLALPDQMAVPDGVEETTYSEDMREELAVFAHEVYTAAGVNYSLESARRCVWRDIEGDLFQESATFLRDGDGKLVGAIWWSADEEPYLGEFIVDRARQGQGYGRYLLNKAIRHMTRRFPNKRIRLNTCREWARARSLCESYGFLPDRMYTNLNLPKLED